MHKMWTLAAAALLAAGGLAGLGGGVSASSGNQVLKVEGETQSSDAGVCSTDGQRVERRADASASGGQILWLPHNGCWAQWTINLPGASDHLTVFTGAGAPSECLEWEVSVDGSNVGRTNQYCGTAGFTGVSLSTNIAAGSHTLRLTSRYTQGPGWADFVIDYIQFFGVSTPPPPECPTNNGPSAPGTPKATDGLAGGAFGWAGDEYSYTFKASGSSDPDGDPVAYTWVWGDDSEEPGALEAEHAFASEDAFQIVLRATDNPSARNKAVCPPLHAKSADSKVYVFRAIPGFQTTLDRPRDGTSCIMNTDVPAVGMNVIAGSCTVKAKVATDYANLIDRVEFRFNKRTFDSVTSSPYETGFNSLSFSVGPDKTLDAVSYAKKDKYARASASKAYKFLNVGLTP